MQPQQNNPSMHSHQIQQMQQMHQQLQVQMQHQSAITGQHNNTNMAPGMGSSSGQSMLSQSRPMGNLHQNIASLLPHQMFPTTMTNQQVQQPLNMVQQAQMNTHQQGHSKVQQALYWNAMAASNTRNAKVNGEGGFSASNSVTSLTGPQNLNTESQLMQHQRSNQSFPAMPSALVNPRMNPMSSNVASSADASSLQNSGMRENKKMTNEQILLLRQQQVIAELQSQIQQITSNGGGNVARPQSSQLASQMMNQKRDQSLSDISSQQVNGQLQQMDPNENFPLFGGMNTNQQSRLDRKNSMMGQQQQHLAMPNNLPNMMNMAAPSASPAALLRMNSSSDFNSDPLQHPATQKQQQFINPLSANSSMTQNSNALLQNQLFQNKMKRQSLNGDTTMMNLGLYPQQPSRRNSSLFFNNNKSVQQAQHKQQQQLNSGVKAQSSTPTSSSTPTPSQLLRAISSEGGSNDIGQGPLSTNALSDRDLFAQLDMSQNTLKTEKNTDLDEKIIDQGSKDRKNVLSNSFLGKKPMKRRTSASSSSKDQSGSKRGSEVRSKGGQKSQGKGKSLKRKLDNDSEENGDSNPKKADRKSDKSPFVGRWQSNDDIPDRRHMIVCVVKVIEQMRPDASKISHKFPLMAKKLEEHLYRSAVSKAEYTDVSTLKKRLQMIAHALGIQKTTDQETDSPFNDDMFPSDDMESFSFDKDISSNAEGNLNGKGENFLNDAMKPSELLLKKTQEPAFQELVQSDLQQNSGILSSSDTLNVNSGMTNMKSKQSSMPLSMQQLLKKQQFDVSKTDSSVASQGDIAQQQHQGSMDLFDANDQSKSSSLNQNFPSLNPLRGTSSSSVFGNVNQLMGNTQQKHSSSNQQGLNFPSVLNGDALQNFSQKMDVNKSQTPQAMNPQVQQSLAHPMLQQSENQGKLPNTLQQGSDAANQRKKQIRLQQQRLLLLRHASKCNAGASCKTQYCAEMVALWKHIKKCQDRYCSTPHCLSSRCVLNHYRVCKREKRSTTCEVCAPVIKRTKSEIVGAEDDSVDQIDNFSKDTDLKRSTNNAKTLKSKISDLDGSDTMNLNAGRNSNMRHSMMINQQPVLPQLPSNAQLQNPSSLNQFVSSASNMNYHPIPQMSNGQQENKLQQQQLLLKQLQQQQAQLLDQQKSIQQQQQLAQPNSAKGEQLSQQLAILYQLQQQIAHQQSILQNVLQEQHAAVQASNQRNNHDPIALPMIHNIFKPSDGQDNNSVNSFKTIATEKTKNAAKRKPKETTSTTPNTEGKDKVSKGKRMNGTNKVNKKAANGKDLKASSDKNKLSKSKIKESGDSPTETTNGEKKAKNIINKKKSVSSKEPELKKNEAPSKSLNGDNKNNSSNQESKGKTAKSSQKRTEDNTTLVSSMSVDSIENHIDSLNDTHLTPRRIAQKCLPIIEKLMNDKYGWVFRDPVDPIELGIPDYFNVVKEPMDLSLVKKKLENGMYENLKTFSRETKLIFENAILYNGENSDVGDMARSLIALFIKEFKPILKSFTSD